MRELYGSTFETTGIVSQLSRTYCELDWTTLERLLADPDFCREIAEEGMKQFEDVYDWYQLGLIHRIRSFSDGELINDYRYDLYQCIVQLSAFTRQPFNTERFPGSVKAAAIIREQLGGYWNAAESDQAIFEDTDRLMRRLTEFETLLRHETNNLNAFVLETVGIFDTRKLIDHAEQHLSDVALRVVSDQTKEDFNAAGRCLAFDLFTACGFHSVRALEATARVYYNRLTGKDAGEEGRPLGGIANEFRKIADDVNSKPPKPFPKEHPLRLIISNLDRINNIYRKPLTHPEMVLKTCDDAKNVFDLATVSIALISEQMAGTLP
jgi:hypothetical protein